MKKISLTVLFLLSVTITISCKKEAKETTDKIETTPIATETSSEKIKKNDTTEPLKVEAIEENTTDTSTETVTETKKDVVKNAEDAKTSVIKKAKKMTVLETKVVKEKAEIVKEEVTAAVEETTKEVVEEITKPVKEVVKETPKQLTTSEKIALGKTLFTTGICKNCHHQTKKMIGPTLVTIGSIYKKKNGSIATLLKGNGKPIVEPKRFNMMKPNIDDVTRHMSIQDLEGLEAYILSFAK